MRLMSLVALGGLLAASSAFAGTARDTTEFPSATLGGTLGTVGRSQGQVVRQEATLFDSGGFTGYADGNLIGQNGWTSFPAAATTYTVSPTAGVSGGKGVVATGVVATSNYAFPTVAYTPPAGMGVSVNFDMARSVAATAALSSASYSIDMFDSVSGARLTRIGLSRNATTNAINVFVTAPFNTTTGQFDPAGTTNFNVTVTSALTAGTFYNLEPRLNFATKKVDVYSNNALFLANVPFAYSTSAQTSLGDADISISTGTGNDSGVVDNYLVSSIVVPEPTGLAALGLGATGLLARRRKA